MNSLTLRKYANRFGHRVALLGLFVAFGGLCLSLPEVALSGGLLVFAGLLAMVFGLVGSF